MPRIRTIKPSFFTSEDVSVLPFRARLTWVGLWTQADDQGRTKDNTRLIKGDVWPLDDDVSLDDIEEDLTVLAAHGRVIRYEVDGVRYLQVVNWHHHQKISKPTPSRIPGPERAKIIDRPTGEHGPREGTDIDSRNPPGVLREQLDSARPRDPVDNSIPGASPQVNDNSRRTPGTLPEDSRNTPGGLPWGKEGKGKEGKGRDARATAPTADPSAESPPPPKCDDHLDHPDPPPCGRCADARKTRERYDRDQATAEARAQSERARQRAAAARAAIDACRLCDVTGYRNGALCNHDPDTADRTRRGAAAVRAAITRPNVTLEQP